MEIKLLLSIEQKYEVEKLVITRAVSIYLNLEEKCADFLNYFIILSQISNVTVIYKQNTS